PPDSMISPTGNVNTSEMSPLLIVQPLRSTARAVGLNNSTQPPGKSPLGKTSLIRIGGGETVTAWRPTFPATVATISVLPGAIARICPVVGLIPATSGKAELQVTGPASIGAPD